MTTTPASCAKDPLGDLLELLASHPSPARLLPTLGFLLVVLERDLLLAAIDEELARSEEAGVDGTDLLSPVPPPERPALPERCSS